MYGKQYKKGDLVWLHCPAVPKGRSRKLHRPWQGPYVIAKVIGEAVYRIKLLSNPQLRKVVHYNRLKPYEGSKEEDDSIIWAKLNKQPETEIQCETSDSEQPSIHESRTRTEDEQSGSPNDDDETEEDEPPPLRRSTRNRRPPQ